MHIFYCPDTAHQPILDEQESLHAVKVLRLKKGDQIEITDGKGGWYQAEITEAHAKHCAFKILNAQQSSQKNFNIHLAIAPTKNIDRIEWMLEKCTEIGIDTLSFLECAQSERKNVPLDRLEKIVLSAIKQSKKAFKPQLNTIEKFSSFIDRIQADQKLIAHLEEGERKLLKNVAQAGKNYCILIGPEGDFRSAEIAFALQKGFQPVSLGPERLRTETAGLVACTTLNLLNQK